MQGEDEMASVERYDDNPMEGAYPEIVTEMGADEALARLKAGNEAFLREHVNEGDVSLAAVRRLFEEGQAPFACIVTCADSRVVPEHLFMAGLGELFCIRVAGNVVGDLELASCLYAVEHLHTPLIVVLGHTHCGAIETAIEAGGAIDSDSLGAVAPLVSSVSAAIGDERDPYAASVANVKAGIRTLAADAGIAGLMGRGLRLQGAIYHTHSGLVEFL